MTQYQGLLLDFYGTLVHEDDEIIATICDRINCSVGVVTTDKDIAAFWWESFSQLFTKSFGTAFLSQREAAVQSLAATLSRFESDLDPSDVIAPQFAHWAMPGIFPDTRPFLDVVASSNMPVCIVSNIDRIDIERAISFHNLYFDHIVTSDDVQSYKPRPEMFHSALQKLGMAPDQVLHVGDSRTSDVMGAKNLNIPVAWVNRSGKRITSGQRPDYTVRNLEELTTLL